MPVIEFTPFEKRVDTDGKSTILDLALKAGIPLQSTCGGKGICGKCRVVVENTDGLLPPPSDRELEALGEQTKEGCRLACGTVITHDAVVHVPGESLIGRQAILTSETRHPYPVRLSPGITSCYVEVPPPVLGSVTADRERLVLALRETYGIDEPVLDPPALRRLPRCLRSDGKGVSVAVRDGREIIDIRPGREDRILGVAFDLGTTTVVAYLMDLLTGEKLSVKAAMNPQIQAGDDLISRISFCQEREGGLDELQGKVAGCLNSLIGEVAAEARIEPDRVIEATLVGNTAMHHIFMGLDPRYLSMAPYPPVLQEAQDFKARDLGLHIGSSAYVHLLPVKAGFVGSDTVACVLATGLNRGRVQTLLIDLGTNGEIVFGNRERMLACSTAAGPAFEGGHIRCGMRASTGAIERVKIDHQTLNVKWRTVYGGRPSGLCGSGIISAVAEMIRAGIVLSRGNFNEEIRSPRIREGEDGLEFVLVPSGESASSRDIVITERDVAELQMAKSAVNAGATLLMERFEVEEAGRVFLAGAGGSHIDPLDAHAIGLFPASPGTMVEAVGNAAGHGACLALLDRDKREEADRIARTMGYEELAATTRFQELFVEGMFFSAATDYEDEF